MQITLVQNNGNIQEVSLEKLLKEHKQTILYFYPKDNTPGCSIEAKDFSGVKDKLLEQDIAVIGVSKDSEKSHCDFIEKQALTIDLISDPNLELHNKYGVWGEKKNYGKVYEGTIRSTFLLDQEGNSLKEWRNIKATGHVERLLNEL